MSYYSVITDVELEVDLTQAETPIEKEEWDDLYSKAMFDKENFIFHALEVEANFSPEGEMQEVLFGTAGEEGKTYHIKEDLLLLKNLFDKHKVPFQFTVRVDGEDSIDTSIYQISSKEERVLISYAEITFSDFVPMD